MKKKVFVIGLDAFNLGKIQNLPEAQDCDFVPALYFSEIRSSQNISIPDLLKVADKRIKDAGGIDAVVTWFDFPATLLLPVMAKKYHLQGPTLESVLKCEHKYWSRLEQQKVIPAHIPRFKVFDPHDLSAWDNINFHPPFWVKPVKSYNSYLAYQVNNSAQFEKYMQNVRRNIDFFCHPFNYIQEAFNMPAMYLEMKETMIAETQVGGYQCTAEGYVYEGEVVVYGFVDSVSHKNISSFCHYLYPSVLPQALQSKMTSIIQKVIPQLGLDNTAFNVEFFCEKETNNIFLLEVNPRMSQSHADIFEKVHGYSHHRIMLHVALNRKPPSLSMNGKFKVAGHFMLRAFKDAWVKKVPDQETVDQLKQKYPGLTLSFNVREGMYLRELREYQLDSYSYVLANLNLGAQSKEELLEQYKDIVNTLDIDLQPR